MKAFFNFFDNLEDKVRYKLSRRPNLYAFISGIGIVLFFRGVWMLFDASDIFYKHNWSGWLTLLVSMIILLLTGTLVSHNLDSDVVISGRLGKKKATEIKLDELQKEEVAEIRQLKELKNDITELKTALLGLTEEIRKKI